VSATQTSARVSAELRAAAEELVLEEAARIDARRYEAWLELFAVDAEYWVPLRENQPDPHTELNIVYDDLARMRDRIVRLTGAFAHAQDPPSRTVRSIAGFRYEAAGENEVIVRSTFVLLEVRSGRQQTYGGRYTHRLRGTPASLLIVQKTVELVNSEEPFGNMTFLL
jgi:3-phenylpropionate/cinnamic acid dioxygenase small subunit